MNANEQTAVPGRGSALIFAQRMEAKLARNIHKGGRGNWLNTRVSVLLDRLLDEVIELEGELEKYAGPPGEGPKEHAEAVANECADVANFAMMIADWHLERAKLS